MGANVNIPNVVGTTPLMLSIRNEEFCRYLVHDVEHVDISKRDTNGLTALDHAICNGYFNTAFLLLKGNIYVDSILIDISHSLNNCKEKSDRDKISILQSFINQRQFDEQVIASSYELLSVGLSDNDSKKYLLNKATTLKGNNNNDIISCYSYHYLNFINIVGDYNHQQFKSKIQEIFICLRFLPKNTTFWMDQVICLSKLYYNNTNYSTAFKLLIYLFEICCLNDDYFIYVLKIIKSFFNLFITNSSCYNNKYYCQLLIYILHKINKGYFKSMKNNIFLQLLYFVLDLLFLSIYIYKEKLEYEKRKEITYLLKTTFHQLYTHDKSLNSMLHIVISFNYDEHINNTRKKIYFDTSTYEVKSVLLKYLTLECKGNINIRNFYTETPLFVAVKSCQEDIIELLVEQLGAHVDQNIDIGYNTSCYEIVMNNVDVTHNQIDHIELYSDTLRQILSNNNITLQCIAARSVKKLKGWYKNKLNSHIEHFIDLH